MTVYWSVNTATKLYIKLLKQLRTHIFLAIFKNPGAQALIYCCCAVYANTSDQFSKINSKWSFLKKIVIRFIQKQYMSTKAIHLYKIWRDIMVMLRVLPSSVLWNLFWQCPIWHQKIQHSSCPPKACTQLFELFLRLINQYSIFISQCYKYVDICLS